MYNWSTDSSQIKSNPEAYTVWKLEQLVNFGLEGGKIEEKELRQYWDKLKLDPSRKHFLELLLNGH